MRSGAVEALPGPVPVDAHHQGEVPGGPGLHSCHRVLDHRGVLRRDLQQPRALQEGVRRGLARQPVLGGPVAVHDPVEGVLQARGGEHHRAVAARGHQAHRHAGLAQPLDQRHGAVEHAHAVLGELLVEVAVLGARLALHRPVPGLRLVVAARFGEDRPAGGEQRADAVLAASAVHVGAVLAAHVERTAVHLHTFLGRLQAGIREQLVEELLPSPGVHTGGVRDHPVHVEDDGGVAGAQHIHRLGRRTAVHHTGHGGGERGGGKSVHGAGTPRTGDGDLERMVLRGLPGRSGGPTAR